MSHDWDALIGRGVDRALTRAGMAIHKQAVPLAPHDKGRLRTSLGFATDRESNGDGVSTPHTRYTLHVGTNVVYAQIHEFGGTIRAKSGKLLAIPFHPSAKGRSPKDFPNLHYVKSGAGGTPRLMNDDGQTMFLLKPRVTIRAKPYLRPAFDDMQLLIPHMIAEDIRKSIKEGLRS